MNTTNKVSVGLTQFIDFTHKGSAAKTNMVRKIKYQDDYHPAFDYWKQLRDEILRFHELDLSFDCFESLIKRVDSKKKSNYTEAVKQYKKFLNKKEVVWFEPGKSTWMGEELTVRSSPELGLIIDGEPHLIKLYFKGKTDKIDKRSIASTLTLMNHSIFENAFNFEVKHAVLNLQKNRFYSEYKINVDKLIALEAEASQFLYIWNKV